jgi:hypothetical protein
MIFFTDCLWTICYVTGQFWYVVTGLFCYVTGHWYSCGENGGEVHFGTIKVPLALHFTRWFIALLANVTGGTNQFTSCDQSELNEFTPKNLDSNIFLISREQNTQADYLSRILDIDDWAISTKFFQFIDELWGPLWSVRT